MPYHTGSHELRPMIFLGDVYDRLVAVLLELALTERGHRSGQFGFRHAGGTTAPCRIRASHAPRRDATTRPHARLTDQRRRPAAFSSAVIFSTACSTSEGLRAPVQTSLPLPNSRRTTFGSSMRQTSPGNRSGSYSTFPRPTKIATAFKSLCAPTLDPATMF